MSAEALGRDLLSEVKEEGLDEVRGSPDIKCHLQITD